MSDGIHSLTHFFPPPHPPPHHPPPPPPPPHPPPPHVFISRLNSQAPCCRDMQPPPAASQSPLPRGIVTAVCRRPPAATGAEVFERFVQADGVPVPLGLDGLEGSQEWHRLEKNAGKLSSADASDRAILMQALHPASAAPFPFPLPYTSLLQPTPHASQHVISASRMPRACCAYRVIASQPRSSRPTLPPARSGRTYG